MAYERAVWTWNAAAVGRVSHTHLHKVQSPPSTAGRTKLDPGTSCTGAGTVQWQLQVDSPRVQEESVARKQGV